MPTKPAPERANRLTDRDDLRLRAARRKLLALINVADERCACAPHAKEEVRSYVETWILPLIEDVLGAEPWSCDAAYRNALQDAGAREVERLPYREAAEVAKRSLLKRANVPEGFEVELCGDCKGDGMPAGVTCGGCRGVGYRLARVHEEVRS